MPHGGAAVWFTGLSGAGKTTLCRAVEVWLRAAGYSVEVLDGDELRRTVNADLGFTLEDRMENVRRIGAMAERLVKTDRIVLVAAITPYRAMREAVRRKIPAFMEVYVNAPLQTCIERDTKGFYRRALAGEIKQFTGVSDPYEEPLAPEVECLTAEETVATSVEKTVQALTRLLLRMMEAEHASSAVQRRGVASRVTM